MCFQRADVHHHVHFTYGTIPADNTNMKRPRLFQCAAWYKMTASACPLLQLHSIPIIKINYDHVWKIIYNKQVLIAFVVIGFKNEEHGKLVGDASG
ncbi:hypothetical protein M378DRAFT_872746 [Amanita muscaria Koide BX008]|uniref:Uncharacterized protein n=1 Tax=Amanita muscaria (strain Koide BX008) TaxID=946122 RepID=A0A0C2VZ91_AMAMK|nr:hypothetical protein M378DRAFT_872746 [Amanita muscaria Koide BX008]